MGAGVSLRPGSRSGAIDMVRVMAMLAIIKTHSAVNESLWNIYCGFLSAGAGVVFFFFCAALFLKSDILAIYKRAGWLFACYAFWGVLAWWLIWPIVQYWVHCITGGNVLLSFPPLETIPLSEIILWDWTQTFPHTGVLWFLRLLLLLTLVSPFLIKLPGKMLAALGGIFWSIRYTGLVSSPEYQEWLPFILTAEWPAVSVSAYMLALAVSKTGGVKLFLECSRYLYPVAAAILVLRLVIVVSGYKGCMAGEIEMLVPFALCSLLLWLERFEVFLMAGGLVSRLAPCIFSVYILHVFLNSVVYVAGYEWFEGVVFRGYCMLFPVIVFVLCWLIYQLLVRIPHCSMLLCFVPRRKS